MSAEGFVVSNPKDNNVDLEVTFVGRDGTRKKFKTLRPGEACRCDKKRVTVEEVARPPRLLITEHGFVPDKAGRPMRLKVI